ncbi:MAG: hAT transposon family protein [Candidatus Babeliales bacterium]|nr:hAT transposon family protein [Candidatus Babeliales bacterium]
MALCCFTASFVSPETFDFHTVYLSACPLEDGSSATEVQETWKGPITEILPKTCLVATMTVDPGRNMVAAGERFTVENTWQCLCHRLHTISCKVVTECDEQRLTEHIFNFISWSTASPYCKKFWKMFQCNCGEIECGFKQVGETRFLTFLDAIDSYLQNWDTIKAFIAADKCNLSKVPEDYVFTPDDKACVEMIAKLFNPVCTIVCLAEGDHEPTLCHVPAWINELLQGTKPDIGDSAFITPWKKALHSKLQAEFEEMYKTPSLPLCAAVFHPKYGHLPWVTPEVREQVWKRLVEEAEILNDDGKPEGLFSREKVKAKVEFEALRSVWMDHNKRESVAGLSVQQFWKDNKKDLSSIIDTACMFLAIPASSAASERLWKGASFTLKHKKGMKALSLESSTIIRGWTKQPSFDFDTFIGGLQTLIEQQASSPSNSTIKDN